MSRQPWPYATKLTISLLLLLFFLYLLSRFQQIVAPIIISIIIAYILTPVVNNIQKRLHLPRSLIVILTYIIFLAIIAIVLILIIPRMGNNLDQLQINPQQIFNTIENALAQDYKVAGITIHPSALAAQLLGALQGLLQPVVGQTINIVKSIITSIVWIIFILLVSFYLIKDGAKFGDWVASHLPPSLEHDFRLIRSEINLIWAAFFRGQLLLSTIVAGIFITIGLIIGLPYAIGMGILAGILEFLPSIGHGIWLVIASLLAFFLGSTWIPLPNWIFMLIVIGLHLIFEQFDLNYLIPRIVGRRVHLPPLVVILGIVTGAILAGIIGIPLAAPTIASMRVIGRYIFANLFNMEWTPISSTQPLPPPKVYWWQRNQRKEKSP
jgi:predicted PurR-regulated permease PerM